MKYFGIKFVNWHRIFDLNKIIVEEILPTGRNNYIILKKAKKKYEKLNNYNAEVKHYLKGLHFSCKVKIDAELDIILTKIID